MTVVLKAAWARLRPGATRKKGEMPMIGLPALAGPVNPGSCGGRAKRVCPWAAGERAPSAARPTTNTRPIRLGFADITGPSKNQGITKNSDVAVQGLSREGPAPGRLTRTPA